MKKWLHYGLLLAAAACFLIGIIVVMVGYLRYLDVYDHYNLHICQIVNKSTISNQDSIELRVLDLADSEYRKWLVVPSFSNYDLFQEIPCYVAMKRSNASLVVVDIQIEPYTDATSLIIGLSFLTACLIILITFLVIIIVERHPCGSYRKVIEIPSDFRYQDSPIYHQEVAHEERVDAALHSFEEAQRMLWLNKHRLRENTFDRLRQEQIVAVMGEHSTRINFQRNVYTALKTLL